MKHAALALFLVVGCTPEAKHLTLTATPPAPASGPLVVHSAGPATLLAATVEDAKGKTIRGAHIVFASSDPKVATVDPKGVVTAVKSGTTRIGARLDKAQAEIDLRVSIPARLELCPVDLISFGHCPKTAAAPLLMHAGHRGVVALRLFDDMGHAIDVDEDKAHPMATLTSESAGVATVDASGAVAALTPGQTNLTARVGDIKATLPVKIAPPDFDRLEVTPKTLALKVAKTNRLAAVARLKKAAVSDVSVVWTSSNAGVASVASDGTVKAIGKGKATIAASAGGKTCKVAVAVK